MSESVEIPDAAVVAADRAFWEHPASHGQNAAARNRAIRAALVAARPYLMPTRDEIAGALIGKPIIRSSDKPEGWRGGLGPEEIDDIATEVLALLNGEIKKGEG